MHNPDYYRTPPTRRRIGPRIVTFLALIIILTTIVFAIVITQRLNDQSIALVTGGVLFFVATIIILALVLLITYFAAQITRPRHRQPPAQTAPVIFQVPPTQNQLPNYGTYGNPYPTFPLAEQRHWTEIGTDSTEALR